MVLLLLSLYCEVYKVDGFVFDFESSWHTTKGRDPNSSLRLEKDSYYAEFIKLEDELSDFYIKTRLEEQRQQIEAKAIKTSAVKTTNIHTKSKAYYFTYQDKKESIIALFTYDGVTYSFISFGVDEDSFKKLIFTFRKEGEVVEIPKPPPKPKKILPKPKPIEETNLGYISITDKIVSSTSMVPTEMVEGSAEGVELSTITLPPEKIVGVVEEEKPLSIEEEFAERSFMDRVLEYLKKNRENTKMPFERRPFNPYLVTSIILLYLILSFYLRAKFSGYSNLRIKPYPKDLPPDFLFPFIITRVSLKNERIYQILTRPGQTLSATISYPWRGLLSYSLIMLISFHALWSISTFFNKDIFEGLFLSLPFGGYLLSFVEIPFIIVFIISFYKKKTSQMSLVVKDPQMADLATVIPMGDVFVVKDAKGREAIKVKRIGFWKRRYIFLDEDDKQIVELKDEHPEIWIWIKLLGNWIIKKRCYYSLRNERNEIIGFLYLDPSNFDHYQLHFDFDYMRLVNSVQLLSAILCIISIDSEEHILYV